MTDFGKRLKALRLERRINQRDLAKEAGIDPTYLSKVETGRMDPPAGDTVRRLAQALAEDPTELLLLARKIPADVKDIITDTPEAAYFLRTAREAGWGSQEWAKARERLQQKQGNLFGEDEESEAE